MDDDAAGTWPDVTCSSARADRPGTSKLQSHPATSFPVCCVVTQWSGNWPTIRRPAPARSSTYSPSAVCCRTECRTSSWQIVSRPSPDTCNACFSGVSLTMARSPGWTCLCRNTSPYGHL